MSRTLTSCFRARRALDRYANPALWVTYLCAPAGSISRTFIQDLRVNTKQILEIDFRGKAVRCRFASPRSNPGAQNVISHQLIDAACVLGRIARRYGKARLFVVQPLPDTTTVECDNRFPLSHRLDANQAKW